MGGLILLEKQLLRLQLHLFCSKMMMRTTQQLFWIMLHVSMISQINIVENILMSSPTLLHFIIHGMVTMMSLYGELLGCTKPQETKSTLTRPDNIIASLD